MMGFELEDFNLNFDEKNTNRKIQVKRQVSINGNAFHISGVSASFLAPDIEDGVLYCNQTGSVFEANIQIPDGAQIIGAVLWGQTFAGETWSLNRKTINTAGFSQIGTGNFSVLNNSTINHTNSLVDNQNYSLYFKTSALTDGDDIRGAYIEYLIFE